MSGAEPTREELDAERAALLEEITGDILLAKRYKTLPAESIAALERTAAQLRAELAAP